MGTCGIDAVAATVALAMLSAPPAAADSTLVLYEHDTFQQQADGQYLFAGDVFDRPGGMFLGTASGSCTDLTDHNTVCNATLNLAGGQLVVQGTDDMEASDTHPLTVLGGTGIHQNAAGAGTVQIPQDVPDQADANFVLNLTSG